MKGGDNLDAVNIINLAGTIISQSITHTTELITAFGFMLLPMGFIFGRKFIGMTKSLTMQSRGRRR